MRTYNAGALRGVRQTALAGLDPVPVRLDEGGHRAISLIGAVVGELSNNAGGGIGRAAADRLL